jgi:hypothetical protein
VLATAPDPRPRAPGRGAWTGQERHDRIGDDGVGSPGQVMSRAFDEDEAGIRQGAGQPIGGSE